MRRFLGVSHLALSSATVALFLSEIHNILRCCITKHVTNSKPEHNSDDLLWDEMMLRSCLQGMSWFFFLLQSLSYD